MDWLTFFAKVIESLAWPVGAVVLVGVLREDIRKLAPWIKKLKAGPVEAEMFERKVEALKEAVAEAAAPAAPAAEQQEIRPPDTASKEFLMELAERHPRSGIIEAWLRVEAAARALAATTEDSSARLISPLSVAKDLLRNRLMTEGQFELFRRLFRLRSTALHEENFDPTFDSAASYIELATFLQSDLEGRLKSLKSSS